MSKANAARAGGAEPERAEPERALSKRAASKRAVPAPPDACPGEGAACGRPRGRPQVRPDAETARLVLEAAEQSFAERGYADTTIDEVAKAAGVAKKTIYRLFGGKADLLGGIIRARADTFTMSIKAESEDIPLDEALFDILEKFTRLVLSPDAIAQNRLSMAEAQRFPEVAAAFYEHGRLHTTKALAEWLAHQCARGLIVLDDPLTVASILLSMAADEPLRRTSLGIAPPLFDAASRKRIATCVSLFLDGCRKPG
ncbi:TetR/AcrR family transcriptional regulator [Roseixanthobacter glucoisosaccharinicivorans]|uniref:TetR/AcrR family transcriptional regulator n=1 Tax=Roseixanthobacter glucoisosaccharinicivorans TaxID=3119923 RepID=UPI0037283445